MKSKKVQHIILFLVNIICVFFIAFLFVFYVNSYYDNSEKQNINDITHLNESSTNLAVLYLSDMNEKLQTAKTYIQNKDFNYEEASNYLYDVTTSSEVSYQLVDTKGFGYQFTKDDSGNFIDVKYDSHEDLMQLFSKNERIDGINVTPEFTDYVTKVKSFATYSYISLKNNDSEINNYTIMLVTNSFDFENTIQSSGNYDGIGLVIINESGDYIISNDKFKSTNFYRYLKVFNDLTLDQSLDIKNTVVENKNGNLFYKDAQGNDCIFVYSAFNDDKWYSITTVPLGSFSISKIDLRFTIYGLVLLLGMLFMDVLYLSSLNKKLQESARRALIANNAKSDFLSRMSHDIRTPLNGIIGMTQVALEENENITIIQEYLNKINLSGEFLLGLVNDILDVSKIEKGKMQLHIEPYSYYEFIDYINSMFDQECKKKEIEFTATCEGEYSVLLIDKLRFNQICFNLISNSIKYTPKGGKIEFKCEVSPLTSNKVRLVIKVIDNGIGMSKEYQKHMFEAFSQEDNNKYIARNAGSGLGLTIVYGFVKLMNGIIQVESEENKGTTFTVSLDVEAGSELIEDTSHLGYEENFLANRRVLVVEDNNINEIIVVKLLENVGAVVDVAINGKEAVEKFEASEINDYDLILMDINMPVMDGYTATKIIRGLNRNDALYIPIIAMTANAYDEDIKNALEAGMNYHISKPIELKKVYNVLNKFIKKTE